MKLQSKPFGQIKSVTKKIEIHLFDEKRQKIQVGDMIVFSCMDNELDTIQQK
jgi:ASC-1-like (ASCH) protein